MLDLWERGAGLHPIDQGLMLLGAVNPEVSYESLAEWPLGLRNCALAELRCTVAGANLQGWVSCPECEEKLEFEMDGRALVAPPEITSKQSLTVRGHSFRLPTSRDLALALRETDEGLAAVRLLENCRLDAGEAATWSDADIEAIEDGMAAADPMAETRLTFQCSNCAHEWDEPLDVVSFVWTGIEAMAKRILGEIHSLASAYGWTETEILSLSERRRSLYLEMVRQ